MKKTIFVTLYPTNVFKNLLVMPQGVVDLLNERREHRIVLLTSKRTAEIIRERHREKLGGGNIVLEAIKKVRPTSFPQRSFYFFYSYLIFTSTTRTLATWGVRTDTPPAGGNRRLAFVKWIIANTFGQSAWVKERVVPFLYHKIFRGRPYAPLFDAYQPDLVFLSNIAHFPDQEILAEAERRKVKTLGMASNWDHFNKYFAALKSDVLLAQNRPIAREAIELQGYREEAVTPVGFPQFDVYHRIEEYSSTREEFLRSLRIPERSKLILFIAGSVHYVGEPDVIRKIVAWTDRGEFGSDAYLLIRLYPGTTKEKFSEFEGDPKVLFDAPPTLTTIEGLGHMLNQIRHADVIISIYSTTLVEAAILNTPLVTIGFDGDKKLPFHQSIRRAERMSHIRHIIEDGYVRIVRSYDELLYNLKAYLADATRDAENRKKLVAKMCHRIDGLSSRRIVRAILGAV